MPKCRIKQNLALSALHLFGSVKESDRTRPSHIAYGGALAYPERIRCLVVRQRRRSGSF
jgi:hypothetical protein